MKKYFNRSMYFMTAVFILYFVVEIYDGIKASFFSNQTDWTLWNVIALVKCLLIIAALLAFIRFMNTANNNQLFSNESSKLWEYKSILLLILGAFSFVEVRFHNGESLFFTTSIFLSFFCFAMSAIFKEATSLQQENDLTI